MMSDLGLSSSCATPADPGAALGMASEAMSRLLGAADNVYSFVPKPSSLRFFSHGWGDLGKARASRHKMGVCIEGREYERTAAQIPLPAGAGDGSFPSPWAE